MAHNLGIKSFLTFVVCMSLSYYANATVLQLAPVNTFTTVTYNSFQVQSLYLNDQCSAALDSRCIPSGPYPVASGPGQIDDQAIILTGSNGKPSNNITSPFADGTAVDNPFLTPAGGQGTSFTMGADNEPGSGFNGNQSFIGDQVGTWELSISALTTYLGQHDLVFLFDNNQEGDGLAQALSIWGQVRILDAAGAVYGCVEFSTGSGDCGSPVNPVNYVPVVGNYCVSTVDGSAYAIGTAANSGDCNVNVGDYFVNDNLGTNAAEFAVFSMTLNNNLANWASLGYFMSVDVRFDGNNGGAEQLWICGECDIQRTQIPEPGALLLFGLGLVALGFSSHRKQKSLAN